MKKLFISIFLVLMLVTSVFSFQKTPNFLDEFASANETSEENAITPSKDEEISIFIRNPSHSVFFDNKLYFIDKTDKLLKVYDKNTDSFLAKYIDLSPYEITETIFLDGNLYLMSSTAEKNQLLKVDLTNLELTQLAVEAQNTSEYVYETFFAQKLTFDEKEYTLFTISGFRLNPVLALLDNESGEVLKVFDINFLNEMVSTLNFIKVLSYQQADGKAYLIFVYDTTIAYYTISSIESITDLESNSISSWSTTPIPTETARLSSNEDIIDVGFMTISDKDYLSIFYTSKDGAGDFIRLYSFDFENQVGGTLGYSAEFSCDNSDFAVISHDYFTYPDAEKQEIYFHNIVEVTTQEGNSLYAYSDVVDNPNYNIEFFDFELEKDNTSIYKTTITNTQLFSDPWGAKSDIIIESGFDVVKVGTTVLDNDVEVKDYTYCLYSYAGKNHCGFIKTSDIQDKTEISLSSAGYKPRVKVWPGTKLYSLPTNVASGFIPASSLNSKIIMDIEDNYEVEVLDVICAYVANGNRMIKVKVNGSHIGYIEEKSINNPADVVKFVITNATIQNDNTVVYHSASKDSTSLTFTLSEGKNVRINGKRNTSTGWTSITFNDEYGNEFTGFIETDYVKADSWSTLQIVGCVLIAVNVGLLILILLYKKNHLGSHGQKISSESNLEEK